MRLAGSALIIGPIAAALGYIGAGTLVRADGDARFTASLWTPLNSIAVAGNIVALIGLPAILAYHGRRAERLTLVGYVGIFATLVMLNVSEGCFEAFIKPYLAAHGGVPDSVPGFGIFEGVALVCLVVGLISLGIAVIRARVFPRWVGALFLASPVAGFLGLPGALAELSDYLAFIALIAIGLHVLRAETAHTPSAANASGRGARVSEVTA
jgi:hypothetical protein